MFFPYKSIFGSYFTPKRTPSRQYCNQTAKQGFTGTGVREDELEPFMTASMVS